MRKLIALFSVMFLCSSAMAEPRNNIVILFDTSGSMQEQMRTVNQSKWRAATEALLNVVTQVPDNTNIGLLAFNPTDWVYELGPVNRNDLSQAIQKLDVTPRSGTPLGTYLKKATDRLLQEREKSFGYGSYKLLVVTDGDPTNEPANTVARYLPDIISRGITVECIGVSMNKRSILAGKVHRYMSADDPTSLTKQLEETILAEIAVSDDLQQDAFEDLESMPDEMATAVIQALAVTGNHPIGTAPPKKVVVEPNESGTTSYSAPVNTIEESSGPGAGFVLGCVFVFVILIFIVVCSSL